MVAGAAVFLSGAGPEEQRAMPSAPGGLGGSGAGAAVTGGAADGGGAEGRSGWRWLAGAALQLVDQVLDGLALRLRLRAAQQFLERGAVAGAGRRAQRQRRPRSRARPHGRRVLKARWSQCGYSPNHRCFVSARARQRTTVRLYRRGPGGQGDLPELVHGRPRAATRAFPGLRPCSAAGPPGRAARSWSRSAAWSRRSPRP